MFTDECSAEVIPAICIFKLDEGCGTHYSSRSYTDRYLEPLILRLQHHKDFTDSSAAFPAIFPTVPLCMLQCNASREVTCGG